MRLLTQEIPLDCNIFQISCTHFGSRLHFSKGFGDFIDLVESSYAGLPHTSNFVIHHGDVIEGRMIDDKRFLLEASSRHTPIGQIIYATDILKPIASKIITILQGNHDDYLRRFGDTTALICDDLQVPYGTKQAVIQYVHNGMLLFKQFATHGRRGISSIADDVIRREANMKLQLKRHLYRKMGDCVLMTKGHTHRLLVEAPRPDLYLTSSASNGIIKQHYTTGSGAEFIPVDQRWYGNVGAFYRAYGDEVTAYDVRDPYHSAFSSYVEDLELDPIELGFLVTIVRDGYVQDLKKELI